MCDCVSVYTIDRSVQNGRLTQLTSGQIAARLSFPHYSAATVGALDWVVHSPMFRGMGIQNVFLSDDVQKYSRSS
jgi:hypothetical protein